MGYNTSDTTSLTQEEADDLFEQAAESTDNADAQLVSAAILYLEGVLASSAKLATYRQNQSQENVSDIFGHVERLIAYHKQSLFDIAAAAAGTDGAVRSGKQQRIPTPRRVYPYGYEY